MKERKMKLLDVLRDAVDAGAIGLQSSGATKRLSGRRTGLIPHLPKNNPSFSFAAMMCDIRGPQGPTQCLPTRLFTILVLVGEIAR